MSMRTSAMSSPTPDTEEVIAQARLKGWEAMAAKALEDLLAFWTNPPRRRIR
jgi:hypothetical protein